MKNTEALEKFLNSYKRYYNIKTEDVESPFVAEAEFHAHSEHYLLVKAAHLSDIDSNEYVFFATVDSLNQEKLDELNNCAWERGLSRVKPYNGHRNSDVVLVVLADEVDEQTLKSAKKIKFYKSYKFTFFGWSHYKLVVCDCKTGNCSFNRMGKDLKKITKSVFSLKTN